MSSDFDAGDPPKSPGAHCERDGGGGEDGAGNGKKREARQQDGKLHLQHGEAVKECSASGTVSKWKEYKLTIHVVK